jgi:hypothetical protein
MGMIERGKQSAPYRVLATFVDALKNPDLADKLAAQLDWTDDPRVRAVEREDVVRVLNALAAELEDEMKRQQL